MDYYLGWWCAPSGRVAGREETQRVERERVLPQLWVPVHEERRHQPVSPGKQREQGGEVLFLDKSLNPWANIHAHLPSVIPSREVQAVGTNGSPSR